MKVLGLDPGIDNFGYALLEVKNSKLLLKNWDTLVTHSFSEISEKLAFLFKSLQELLEINRPEIIVTEKAFNQRLSLSEKGLFQSQALVLLLGGLFKIPVKSYSPSEIKKTLTQKGNAQKRELFDLIKLLFKNHFIVFNNSQLEENFFKENYSFKISHKIDALAIALTYIVENKLIQCYIP
ncbi:MAG: crossover junction endodeoxyribonuclease RuvC [Thermodesulfobacteriaceae bacterium]|nr:crossover junction endodeoxyribonuclease RuvC [Thermodesulfobacteriaceae bacterium]MDW8135602.1 crossover junction endodeoxyribonuclease RuvC [Thermodesulfobacterium sp.]